jgi:hypothetical protein
MGAAEGPEGWPYVRPASLEDYGLLAHFDCGSEHHWEDEVNEIMRGLGRAGEQENIRVRVAIDPDTGDLVGAGAFRDDIEFVLLPERRSLDNTYIQALGITKKYREPSNRRRVEGYPSVGAFVLNDLLAAIYEHWDGQEAVIWAKIAADNVRCHRLVRAQGFKPILEDDEEGYDTWAVRI